MTLSTSITSKNAAPERRNIEQPENRLFGSLISCTGAKAIIAANNHPKGLSDNWTVSRLISISHGENRIVGMIHKIESAPTKRHEDGQNDIHYHVELIGEVKNHPIHNTPVFDRGISTYPPIGTQSHVMRADDLQAIYTQETSTNLINIGYLSQNPDIPATIDLEMMLSRHFAIVGSTGVGKSSAVSLMMRKAVEKRPQLRILMLDPHNEFAKAFPKHSKVYSADNLSIPYWILNLDELSEVIFRGRKDILEEQDILREIIPKAKLLFRNGMDNVSLRRDNGIQHLVTADTPLPYRFNDLIQALDDKMGLLESKKDLPLLRGLRSSLVAVMKDPRYAFFFQMKRIADNMEQVLTDVFRLDFETQHPISVLQMAGLPSEVVNSLVSVLGRLAFDICQMSTNSGQEILILCEEAHRYMPANTEQSFGPTRYALARVAKEGRKYGCYLGCITQRPGELDATILSQCSTIFAMRLSNEADQALIKSAVSDSSESTIAFISALGQREAIAFGEGVATPMRMKFETIPACDLPSNNLLEISQSKKAKRRVHVGSVVSRLRDNIQSIGESESEMMPLQQAPTAIDTPPEDDELSKIRAAILQPKQGATSTFKTNTPKKDNGRLF